MENTVIENQITERKSFFQKLAEFMFLVYMITLYVFVLNKKTLIISQVCFIGFAGVTVLYLLQRKRIYLINKGVPLAYFFCTWVYASMLWAENIYVASIRVKTVWQIFVLFILVYNLFYENEERGEYLIKSLYVAGIALCIYSIHTYGISEIFNSMLGGKLRLGKEISQENVFGMNHAMTVICGFYYLFYRKKHKIFHTLIVSSAFILAMSSGSRKALLLAVCGVLYIVFLKYGIRKFYKTIIVGVALILTFIIVIQLPMFVTIRERMEGGVLALRGEGGGDASAMARISHIKRAWNLFKESPFVGYGADNYRVVSGSGTYSHNNFVEILVDFGLVGFFVYYLMFIVGAKNLKRDTKESSVFLFIVLISRLVLDFAKVSYFDKLMWIYFSFFLIPTANNKFLMKKEVQNQ